MAAIENTSVEPSLMADDELRIDICWPYGARFYGTEKQLRAEGLVPEDVKMPVRTSRTYWERDGVRYGLFRKQRNKHQRWVDGDWWCLSSHSAGADLSCNGYDTKEIELRRQRECWERCRKVQSFDACVAASTDQQVQALLSSAKQMAKAARHPW